MDLNIKGFFQRILGFIFGKKVQPSPKYNFLVVCTGNTCRSPMAMSILRFLKHEGGVGAVIGNVESAGLSVTEHAAAKNAIEIAKDFGCDLTLHHPQQLNQAQVDWADFILTMDTGAAQRIRDKFDVKGRVMTMATFGAAKGSVLDPYGRDLDTYHKTAIQMEGYLRKGLEGLRG